MNRRGIPIYLLNVVLGASLCALFALVALVARTTKKNEPKPNDSRSEPWIDPSTAEFVRTVTALREKYDAGGFDEPAQATLDTLDFSTSLTSAFDLPLTLTIKAGNGSVEINYETGKVTISEDADLDEASRHFWRYIESHRPPQ